MKTSNKLLIAFAAALILIPIFCIAYVSRAYYEKGDYSSQAGEMDNFGPIPKNVVDVPVNGSFEAISIQGDIRLHLAVTVLKGPNRSVKFSDNLKGFISVKLDSNGQLVIVVKSPTNEKTGNFGRISISAPDIYGLRLLNSDGISLVADLDSLNLNLENTSYANFNVDTKIEKLSVHTKNVEVVSFRETATKSVFLDVNNTNVQCDVSSFDNLSIISAGASQIELNGGYGDKAGETIKNLKLVTLGKSEVRISNTSINNCSGSFSDSTSVQMPAVNINQMYKLKK